MSGVMEIAMKDMGYLIETAQANMKYLPGPVYNVKGFGAKGNGVTDDTVAIQAAIDAAGTASGGTVFFPVGTYIVSSTIDLKSNVHLVFAKGSVVKVADNCTGFYSMFSIKSVENVTISGMTYDGNYDRTNYDIKTNPEIAVYVVDSKNVRIQDNIFNTCGVWTISCEVSATWPYNENIYVERNQIYYKVGKNSNPVQSNGMTIDTTQVYMDAKNYWVTDNIIKTESVYAETALEMHRRNGTVMGNTFDGFRNGILIVPGFYAEDNEAAKMIASDNRFYNIRSGITLWQVPARALDEVIVSNNLIELDPARTPSVTTSKGVLVLDTLPTSNNDPIKNVHIADNMIRFKPFTTAFADSAHVINFVGISIRSWVTLENIAVKDNTIIDAPGTGILIGVSSDSTYANTATNLAVEDNTIINAGKNENIATAAFNPRAAIRLNGSGTSNVEKAIIRNNKIIDNKTGGTYFTNPIYIAAYNVDSCIIDSNPILAFGYDNIDTKKSFTIGWNFDSQVGTPTVSKVANYIQKEKYAKVMATLEVTSIAGFTGGFASYVTLPVRPSETREVPILVRNLNSTTISGVWFLKLVSGSLNAYIGAVRPDNTEASLTQALVKVGTRISIDCEYFV